MPVTKSFHRFVPNVVRALIALTAAFGACASRAQASTPARPLKGLIIRLFSPEAELWIVPL
ncbi:MAG: hypothetical protein JNL19_06235 [Burkholderiales bacterium]|nr:hypothetical protein [Burkholderiales bacterium]